MKIEPRGKYAGVKVHLDGEEAEMFLTWAQDHASAYKQQNPETDKVVKFACKLGGKIKQLISQQPNLLQDRTEEQVKEALLGDKEKIEAQLAALKGGADWKKVS